MTNKEAIKILEVAQVECEWNAPLEYQEAFKMAIEALKAQSEPSTEIQEILNYLDTTLHPIVSPDNWYVYAELHDMVSMLPSAQPEKVKCKKCRYVYYDKEFGNYWCNRKPDSFMVEEDGYCKWGK